MSTAAESSVLSHDEYFALEEAQQLKHEYIAGEVYAMTGGSVRHGLIGVNVTTALTVALRHTPCTAYNSDVRLYIATADAFLYPDAMVLCEEGIVHEQYVENPRLIIEVLSDSTDGYDHGRKFALYRQIEGLQTYIMLHQHAPLAEVYRRRDDGWILNEYSGLDVEISIDDRISLLLSDLYAKVQFPD